MRHGACSCPWAHGTVGNECREVPAARAAAGRGVQLQGTRSLRADAVGAQLREIDVPAPSARRNISCEAGGYGTRHATGTRTVAKRDAP